VPRLLSLDNKRNRDTTSDPKEFLRRFVTVDETWIHWYTPETKKQSKQWTSTGQPTPKKAKTVPSAGKVMATVFWDSQGVIYIDYLEKAKRSQGCTMPNYWADSPPNCRKAGPIWRKKVLFHHDNAPAHTSALVKTKLVVLGNELLPHPPCSPDLAPCFHERC